MQELARAQQIRWRTATSVANRRQAVLIHSKGGYPIHLVVCEYRNKLELTVVLRKLGLLAAMMLFSLSFYYGLARLVMCAASL
jgi:hypothetical protein